MSLSSFKQTIKLVDLSQFLKCFQVFHMFYNHTKCLTLLCILSVTIVQFVNFSYMHFLLHLHDPCQRESKTYDVFFATTQAQKQTSVGVHKLDGFVTILEVRLIVARGSAADFIELSHRPCLSHSVRTFSDSTSIRCVFCNRSLLLFYVICVCGPTSAGMTVTQPSEIWT